MIPHVGAVARIVWLGSLTLLILSCSSSERIVTPAPPNAPPSFLVGADLVDSPGAGPHSVDGWITGISPGPPSEASQTVRFEVTSNRPDLFLEQPSVSPDGTLSYTPAARGVGVVELSVVGIDDGDVANGGQDRSAPQASSLTLTYTTFVANFASDDVTVLDFLSGTVSATIPIRSGGSGDAPGFVIPDQEAPRIWVLSIRGDDVTEVDLTNHEITRSQRLAHNLPSPLVSLAVLPGGRSFAVPTRHFPGITVFDLDSFTQRSGTGYPGSPIDVAFGEASGELFLISGGAGTLSRVNLETLAPTQVDAVGLDPVAVAVESDGSSAYVVDRGRDLLLRVDPTTGATVDSIAVGRFPTSVSLIEVAGVALVTNQLARTVSVIRIPEMIEEAVIPVAGAPRFANATPGGSYALIPIVGSSELAVLDIAARVISRTVTAGSFPFSSAFVRVPRP